MDASNADKIPPSSSRGIPRTPFFGVIVKDEPEEERMEVDSASSSAPDSSVHPRLGRGNLLPMPPKPWRPPEPPMLKPNPDKYVLFVDLSEDEEERRRGSDPGPGLRSRDPEPRDAVEPVRVTSSSAGPSLVNRVKALKRGASGSSLVSAESIKSFPGFADKKGKRLGLGLGGKGESDGFEKYDIKKMERRAERLSDMDAIRARAERFGEETANELVQVHAAKAKNRRFNKFRSERDTDDEDTDEEEESESAEQAAAEANEDMVLGTPQGQEEEEEEEDVLVIDEAEEDELLA